MSGLSTFHPFFCVCIFILCFWRAEEDGGVHFSVTNHWFLSSTRRWRYPFFSFYVVRFDCCRGVFSSPSASLSGSSLHDWLTFIPLDSASVHWLNYLSLSLLAGGGNNNNKKKRKRKIFSFSLRVGGIRGQYNMEQTDISLFLDSIEKDKRK